MKCPLRLFHYQKCWHVVGESRIIAPNGNLRRAGVLILGSKKPLNGRIIVERGYKRFRVEARLVVQEEFLVARKVPLAGIASGGM